MSISMTPIATTKNLIEGALQEASNCADRATGKDLPSTIVVRHDHYYWGWRPYCYQSPCYTPCGTTYRSEKSDRNANLIILAITATIAALAALFSIGESHAHLNEASQRMDATTQQQEKVDAELENRTDLAPLREEMGNVFETQKQVLSLQKQKAHTDLNVNKAFAVSTGLISIGAMAELTSAAAVGSGFGSLAMSTGGIGLLGAGAVWLYRKGFSSSDANIRLEAEKLKQTVERARGKLHI